MEADSERAKLENKVRKWQKYQTPMHKKLATIPELDQCIKEKRLGQTIITRRNLHDLTLFCDVKISEKSW